MKEQHIHHFKNAMANYPTGVTVISTIDENNNPVGLTVNSFASVSIDPLLILWSIDKGVSTFPPFDETDRFAVNILSETQSDIAMTFATKDVDKRFDHCDWELSEHKLPIIKDTAATMQCKVHKKIEAGDHITFIGEIIDIHSDDSLPLLYHRRNMNGFPTEFHEE